MIFGPKAWPSPNVLLPPEILFSIGPIHVTNTMLTSWVALVLLLLLVRLATRNVQLVPHGLQNVFEVILEFFYNLTVSIAGPRKAREIYPYAMTLFLFIWMCNWLGILPFETFGIAQSGGGYVPLFRSVNSDLSSPLAMALVTMIGVQVYGIRHLGFFGYAGKFINVRGGPLTFVVGILELVSEFAKIISFSFRLFGNIFAGTVLLTIIPYLIPVVPSVVFILFELFVGAIQAFIFAILAVVFMTLASTPAHGAETHAAEAQPAGAQ